MFKYNLLAPSHPILDRMLAGLKDWQTLLILSLDKEGQPQGGQAGLRRRLKTVLPYTIPNRDYHDPEMNMATQRLRDSVSAICKDLDNVLLFWDREYLRGFEELPIYDVSSALSNTVRPPIHLWNTGIQGVERCDARKCYIIKTADDLLTDPTMVAALEPYEARINKFLEDN